MPDGSKQNWLVNLGLIAAVVVIFIVSFSLAPSPSEDEEGFVGTDSVVTETIEADGYEPWFSPIFEPGSGEIESGLFAIQAALGAGVLGFMLGNLRGRSKERQLAAAAGPDTTTDQQAEPTEEAAPDSVPGESRAAVATDSDPTPGEPQAPDAAD